MRAYELNESPGKPSLEEFLNGMIKNQYVFFKSSTGVVIASYVRKGPRYIKGVKYPKVLDRANTSLAASKYQNKMMKTGIFMAGTGAYREFDKHMTTLAKKYGYDGIYVENVLNDSLLDVLIRYDYELLPDSFPPSYWKAT